MAKLPEHLRQRFRAAADYHGVSAQQLWDELKGESAGQIGVEEVEDFLEPLEAFYNAGRLSAHERQWLSYK